jgi:hypothetical protein
MKLMVGRYGSLCSRGVPLPNPSRVGGQELFVEVGMASENEGAQVPSSTHDLSAGWPYWSSSSWISGRGKGGGPNLD